MLDLPRSVGMPGERSRDMPNDTESEANTASNCEPPLRSEPRAEDHGLLALLRKVETAIDDRDDLTRIRGPGASEEAKFLFGRDGWTVHCRVRRAGSKSRISHSIHGSGAAPETAVADLLEHLSTWAEALA